MITSEKAYSRYFGPTSAIRRFVQSLVLAVVALARAIAHRRQVRTLLELDERSLQDIGLLRSDVIGALDQPLAKDPSVILMVRSVDRRSRIRAGAHAARRVAKPARAEVG
jgi:uncharacterized protein YjiS (DUF1127 family)